MRAAARRNHARGAARLIEEGTKIEAAMRLAGFSNWTNFNAQFRREFGLNPRDDRARIAGVRRAACGAGDSAARAQ
jgi:AraC-like DNA-binding protein